MPKVAILIAASPVRAFYSQIAAMSLALRKLRWTRWEASVYAYIGGEHDAEALAEWLPHLRDVGFAWVSNTRFAREGDWAQSDAVFELAPRDADVLLAMDADTLPVADLEGVLDRIVETGSIAGVIAHYPPPPFPGTSPRDGWTQMTEGLIDAPLDFAFRCTLLDPSDERSLTPFYLNFGVVFFPRITFDDVACRYLALRPKLMGRMFIPDFSGQVALTLAIAAAGARTCALPMRYNFPNDPIAEMMYPEEQNHVAVFHYLRTERFDRHKIFTTAEQYSRFLALPLAGAELSFQRSVRRILGSDYPFS